MGVGWVVGSARPPRGSQFWVGGSRPTPPPGVPKRGGKGGFFGPAPQAPEEKKGDRDDNGANLHEATTVKYTQFSSGRKLFDNPTPTPPQT